MEAHPWAQRLSTPVLLWAWPCAGPQRHGRAFRTTSLLITLPRMVRCPHSHRSTLPLCHVLAPAVQKAEEILMAKVLAHAPPVPRSSFSVFFRTRLTPVTGWAAPVSSPLRGQQDLTKELSGTGAAGLTADLLGELPAGSAAGTCTRDTKQSHSLSEPPSWPLSSWYNP